MKTETKNKIQTVNEALSAGSSIIALAVPAFASVPLIVFGVNRAIGFISDKDIIKRLKKIENNLKSKKISNEKFKNRISRLSEHKRFYSSSTLENIIKNCIPETVDIYISLFIDYIMTDKYDLEEELCEIISTLNKHDFELLCCIKDYLNNGSRDVYKEELEKEEKSKIEYNNKISKNNSTSGYKLNYFRDRSIILGESKTIFWDDFASYCNLPKLITLNDTMLFESYNNNDEKTYSKWNYYGKSFIKLERCGILRMDYRTFLGTMNSMDISRFHLTTLGLEILKYIKI